MSPSLNAPVKSHTEYGDFLVKKLDKLQRTLNTDVSGTHNLVLQNFRVLIADLCQQFNGGHPGGAIGMAAIGIALWKYVMRYSPKNPTFFNRDRFVLSNGHTALFQYAFLHLTGYESMTLDQLKSYHSKRADALCAGHPEIEVDGIEVTTGPLGQGVANAVGLAMASKHLEASYNRPDAKIVNNHIFCMIGDACLQEGVGLEAVSLAGHLRLDNLTVIYDNNQVTCDGSVDLSNTEDVNAKMAASGWEVLNVEDGCFDVEGIVQALQYARKRTSGKPTFLNVKTIIGVGSAVAGSAVAHGAAFGSADVSNMKRMWGLDPKEDFVILDETRRFFEDIPAKGEQLVAKWNEQLADYAGKYPESAVEFHSRVDGELPCSWEQLIPSTFPTSPTPSRKSSGLVFNPIAKEMKSFMVGTADLTPSVYMNWKGMKDFQHPTLKTACGINGDYEGRYIHYGVREHAMAAIANGMAAYSPGTIIPVTSTFFMFYMYAAPAVRMGALQRLQVIHVATHDSIGMGEDGPTHQPIELAALYRAMPNILYIRPGDSEEVAGAWIVAIKSKNTPSIISTSRHAVPQLKETKRALVESGAYVLREEPTAEVTLIGVGAELTFAIQVAEALYAKCNIKARVLSFPCQRLFEKQPQSYKRDVLKRHLSIPIVVIEPYAVNGWERYAHAGICMKSFGHSLPGPSAYAHFGFEIGVMTDKVLKYLHGIQEGSFTKDEFVDL